MKFREKGKHERKINEETEKKRSKEREAIFKFFMQSKSKMIFSCQ
jgi:hypothetical protein